MLPSPTAMEVPMRRSAPIFVALRWGAAIAVAAALHTADQSRACPLSGEECVGIVRNVSQLDGGELDRLRRGERVLEIRKIDAAAPARTTEVAGALIVAAPPSVAWAVITDFRSWPRFVPHLEQVELAAPGDAGSPLLLRQDTRVWGFGFSATTRRWIDADQRILWDELAPDTDSDVDAMSGFWQVLDLGDGRSLLRFQSRVALSANLPGPVESWLIERGAPDALEAFAAEIERRERARAPAVARVE
jgi:Polyketide cyclase / dehydrase and lipid transport